MAPRRKRTAGRKGRSTRAKPKLPEGDLDSSMTVEERESRVNDYINDYQIQVDSKLEKMRKCVSTVKSLVANIYRSALIQLPKCVKQMTMGEFMSLGGTIDAAINAQVSESIIGFTKFIPMLSTVSHDSCRIPLSNVLNTHYDLTASHVDEACQSATTSSVTTAGKPERKRKTKKTEDTPAFKKPVVTAVTRTSRRLQAKVVTNKTITPMPNVNTESMLHTPFITPKFDPRLPITPAIMRQPKAGERIVSMRGSPLTNPAGPNIDSALQVFIPLTGGKTMQLSVDDKWTILNGFDVANDNVALQNIKLLQEKLSLLLKLPKNMEL